MSGCRMGGRRWWCAVVVALGWLLVLAGISPVAGQTNLRDTLERHDLRPDEFQVGETEKVDVSPLGFIRHCLGSFVGPNFTDEVARGNANEISSGQKHPWQKCVDGMNFFGVKDLDVVVKVTFKVALHREPTAAELKTFRTAIERGYSRDQFIRDRFNDPRCPYLAAYGPAVVKDATISGSETLPGYSGTRFQKVVDLVKTFCDVNRAYEFAKGHTVISGFHAVTDCSGFTGSFIDKILKLAGLPSPLGSWFPSSQNYATDRKLTRQVTGPGEYPPPTPRDKIQPGDIFVLSPPAPGKSGHVGLFMGYDRAGNALIAHSTPGAIKSATAKYGHIGQSGVRIEVMPASYRSSRLRGIFRMNQMDEALDRLAKS